MSKTTISRRSFLAMSASASAAIGVAAWGGEGDSGDWGAVDKVLADSVANQDVPFIVGMVANQEGIVYHGTAGSITPTQQAAVDTPFRILSATKAIGGLAAMILVERNKLSLDTPVGSIIPDLGQVQVLDSMGPKGPVYRPPVRAVTLRHLLTHTSGLAVNVWNSKENEWELATHAPGILDGARAGFMHPLMFDPGDSWTYGVGYDWAGMLVQAVDGRRIDQFVQEEILNPLRMADTMFEPDSIKSRLPVTKLRNADGSIVDIAVGPPSHPEVYGMGQALYSTPSDYIRFLRLILNDGVLDGRRLVAAATVAQMKANQIGTLSVPVMKTVAPTIGADVDLFPGTRKTHTFAFMRNEVDIPGMRRAGSLTWAGALNTHYWIDPSMGIAAVLWTQSLPFVEPRFMNVYAAFEQKVYQQLG